MPDVEPPSGSPPPNPGNSGADLLPPQLQTLARRAAAWAWLEWIAGLALLALVAAGAAYLVTPGLYGSKVPAYDDAQAGELARFTVKADRDYDIPDDATTAAQRDDASAQVRPVYDYDLSVAQGALSRVRAGFLRMQEAVSAARAALPVPVAAPEAPAEKGKKPAGHAPRKDEPLPPALLQAMADSREDLFRELQVALDDDDFRALAEVQFSGEVEQGVELLLRRFQRPMVGQAADELAALGRRGIAVRTFPSFSPRESELVLLGPGQALQPGERGPDEGPRAVAEVPDLDHVRLEVADSAAALSETLPEPARKAAVHLVRRLLRANLTFNASETAHRADMARAAIKPVVIQLKKGDKVIAAGERIDKRHLLVFKGMRAQNAELDPAQVRTGTALCVALLLGGLFAFGKRGLRRFRPTRKDVLLLAGWLLAMLALMDVGQLVADSLRDRLPGLAGDAFSYAIPFAAGAMLVRLVLGAEEALLFSGALAALASMVAGNSVAVGLYAWVGGLVAAQRVAGAKDRAALFRAGLWAGAANALMVVCLQLMAGKFASRETVASAAMALFGGAVLAPILVMGAAPLVEWLGGYVTDMKLLELANLNHPALKELIVQAPGTYHHSIIMGSLVETAAEAVGANPLLARVCAYYHDIGKGKNPLYFGENQKGENRHDQLAPAMSAQLIKKHVSDGMEMARQYKLPKAVADAIPQHHGTKLVGYFFHKATKEHEGKDGPPPDEAAFRYPGPKPQYPEAALVMIADAVEAASRALAEPTDANLQALVKKMINGVFADGQLDECDLTLKDLNVLAKSFFQSLSGIYHSRPQYPPGAMNPPRREEAPTLRAVGEPPSNVKKLGT
jgi:putative nucleotidyltransferase with HDIG domain